MRLRSVGFVVVLVVVSLALSACRNPGAVDDALRAGWRVIDDLVRTTDDTARIIEAARTEGIRQADILLQNDEWVSVIQANKELRSDPDIGPIYGVVCEQTVDWVANGVPTSADAAFLDLADTVRGSYADAAIAAHAESVVDFMHEAQAGDAEGASRVLAVAYFKHLYC